MEDFKAPALCTQNNIAMRTHKTVSCNYTRNTGTKDQAAQAT